jgi:hypothetical protein
MTCPMCQAPLTFREYAWTHTHPTKAGRQIGIGLMMVGAFTAAVGLIERLGRV